MKKRLVTKVLALATLSAMVLTLLAGCSANSGGTASSVPASPSIGSGGQPSGSSADGNSMVLYVSTPEDFLNVILAEFEAETGVKVEVVAAGTGELYKRIEAEGDNPLGDVMLGGMVSSGYMPNIDLWGEYVSVNDKDLPQQYQNTSGKVTSFGLVPSVIMVNKDLIGDIKIEGYADLLNPELKGKIAMPDPNQTSSGWEHLVNMLYAMGGGDDDKGWNYVESLMETTEVKLLQSSSAVHKGVAEGEYLVGLVAEGMVDIYTEEGLNVEKVFMTEGVVMNVDGVAIIDGCKNRENAEKFIDFLTSREFQTKMLTLSPPRRPIRDDIEGNSPLTATSEIHLVEIDPVYIADNKTQMLDRFKDISTNYG